MFGFRLDWDGLMRIMITWEFESRFTDKKLTSGIGMSWKYFHQQKAE